MRDILLSSSSDKEAFRRGESTVLRRENTAFEYISRHALQPIATFFVGCMPKFAFTPELRTFRCGPACLLWASCIIPFAVPIRRDNDSLENSHESAWPGVIQQRAYLGRREIVKIVYVLSWAVIVKVSRRRERHQQRGIVSTFALR